MENININRVTIAESITVTEDDILGDDKLCEKDYTSFAEKCYMQVTTPQLNFKDAAEYCKKNGGGTLVQSNSIIIILIK